MKFMTWGVFTLDTDAPLIFKILSIADMSTQMLPEECCLHKNVWVRMQQQKRNYDYPRKVTLKTCCTTRRYDRYTVFSCDINDFNDIFSVFRSNLSSLRKLLWILLRTRTLAITAWGEDGWYEFSDDPEVTSSLASVETAIGSVKTVRSSSMAASSSFGDAYWVGE